MRCGAGGTDNYFSVTPGQTERRQSSERAAVGFSQHVGHRESLVTYAARRGSRIRRPHCGLELWRRRPILLSRGLRLRRSWTRVTVLVLYKPGPAGPGLSCTILGAVVLDRLCDRLRPSVRQAHTRAGLSEP